MIFSRSKIFLYFIVSFTLGIFLANFYVLNYVYYIFLSLFLLLVFSIVIRQKTLLIVICCIFSLLAGFLYYDSYLEKIIPTQIKYGSNIELSCTVVSYPDEREDHTKYVVSVDDSDDKYLVGKKILIDLPKYPAYKYGDRITIKGIIAKPEKFDEFDYGMYLARYKIFATMTYDRFDESALVVEKISGGLGNKLISNIYAFREKVYVNIRKIFPEPQAGIVAAIILGLKQAIPADFMEKLRIVGLSHIVVISGFHVAVMIKIFQSIGKSWSKKSVFVIGSLFLLFFIILTGASPSVIRASIMAWLFLLAPILGRKGKITNILTFTVLVMLLENPLILLHDVSFELSVLAVLGLIYLMPIFDRPLSRFGKIIGPTISATLSAQIMTLPIVLLGFGRFSIVAPLVNILVTPLLSVIIPYGILISLVSLIFIRYSFILSWPLNFLLKYIIYVVNLFSSFKYSSVDVSIGSTFVAIYFLVLIFLIYLFNFYERKKIGK